jgi:DNA-binding winged helix-turn-helix (wHTH) protein/tetratricopeptide (TPR) repeat protein
VNLAFGDCSLDTDRMELLRAGRPVDIQPQVFDVLAYLATHRDRVVTKHELLDEIWGDRFVSDSALTSRIKTARQLVGDTGRDQRVIKTIHGRGYRFVAEVSTGPGDSTPVLPTAGVVSHERMSEALAGVLAGSGAALELAGDLGRTTDAIDELVDAALEAGLVVGRASGSSRHGRQLCCVVEALDEMAQRRPDLLDQIPPACRTELEHLFSGGLPSTRQRLFVAVRELLTAATRAGAVLVLDELTDDDPDTTRLVLDAARLAMRRPLVVAISRRRARNLPGFEQVQLAESPDSSPESATAQLTPDCAEVLARAALVGPQLDLIDMQAAADGDAGLAQHVFHEAIDAGVLVDGAGDVAHFVRPDVHQELVELVPARQRAATRVGLAEQLDRAGAGPERVAAQLLDAGRPAAAVPFALAAARGAAGAQLHSEVLRWTEAVRSHATGDDSAALLALRADALAATGAPTAVAAYRAAIGVAPPVVARGLRARLARAAMLSGDIASAEEALAGLDPDGGPADGAILLARGMFAYFNGDLDAAAAAAEAARSIALTPGAPAQMLDVITLQGMIAHNRGEWFDRLRHELQATSENPGLATTVFDSHLCVAEYLLYGPTRYEELRRLTDELRVQAERAGARRAVAFAVTVAGEAALLAGHLDDARRDLGEAIELHRETGADTGTAHAMQRLAEVELASGDRAGAEQLARRALPLARWSPLGRHLLQRIYGTLISAAPDPESAMAVVDEATETLDEPMACVFCQVMISVPAAIACAEAGHLDDARRHLAVAELSAAMWEGTSWQAAITEAKAHLARAEGRHDEADTMLADAAGLFAVAGQPLDSARCTEAITSATPAT